MKKLSVLLTVILVIGLATVSHAGKMVDPAMEFLIAEANASYYHDVYKNIVTWESGNAIYYKDLETGHQYLVPNSEGGHNPAIYENTIVWTNTHWPSDDGGIYSYHLKTGLVEKLTTKRIYYNYPKISGQNVVWYWDDPLNDNQMGVGGINLTTRETFEVHSAPSYVGLFEVDIYDDIVVWGMNTGIWAENLATSEEWQIADGSYTIWPYHARIHGDLVVWNNQGYFSPIDGHFTPWDIYGAYLSTGEIFPIESDPLYSSIVMDTNGDIVLSSNRSDTYKFRLWATDVSSGEGFLVADNARGGSIYENLVVYTRDGNVYGNYIIETPEPATIDIYPRLLNLNSKGKRIMCWIKLHEEYGPRDISKHSLVLSIPSCPDCETINVTCGFPLRKRYLAFFPRQELIDEIEAMGLELPMELELKISGELDDGTPFEGLDPIWVIKPERKRLWWKR